VDITIERVTCPTVFVLKLVINNKGKLRPQRFKLLMNGCIFDNGLILVTRLTYLFQNGPNGNWKRRLFSADYV